VTLTKHSPFGSIILCMHLYSSVPSFTKYKDMIKAKILKNGSRDTDHAPFGGGL